MAKTSLVRDVAAVAHGETLSCLWKAETDRSTKPQSSDRERAKSGEDRSINYTQLKTDAASSSSKMKRSHSSPNIAQLMEEDDISIKHRAPQFDRAIKPLNKATPSEVHAVRHRNFNPTYGNVSRGLTGLKNLGNSCYMNSIIQCINNTTPLAFYFVEGTYRDDINRSHKTRGEVVEEVAVVVRALWRGQFRSIACHDLKAVVGRLKSSFQGVEQQDSHEFLTLLMDWLHEDLNKKSGASPIKDPSISENPEDAAWNKFRSVNESLILTLFFGQQKSTVRCCKCNEKSVTYEPFSNLSLPLPTNSNRCTLHDCVRLYLREETLTGWNCPSCKEARDAHKKFDIVRFPPILIVHFKRFHHDGWSRKKQNFVDFPLTSLDMGSFTAYSDQRYSQYNLYGVSNHYGTMEGGHYTAYCRNNVVIINYVSQYPDKRHISICGEEVIQMPQPSWSSLRSLEYLWQQCLRRMSVRPGYPAPLDVPPHSGSNSPQISESPSGGGHPPPRYLGRRPTGDFAPLTINNITTYELITNLT
uniref:Ubiquitin carboxyl-terminal hydrolase n=1 Tax=Timema genevievae TaxID=629358 RepID=A0A7R9PMQ8_TIMGE|nr:unnamed protein product [Timema genevievae]